MDCGCIVFSVLLVFFFIALGLFIAAFVGWNAGFAVAGLVCLGIAALLALFLYVFRNSTLLQS